MAKRTTVLLEDDLTGGPADATVQFGLDGTAYEIDLSSRNAELLRKALAAYIRSGRRIGVTSRAPIRATLPTPRRGDVDDSAAIREWARNNGYDVSSRGRISALVRAAYRSGTGTQTD